MSPPSEVIGQIFWGPTHKASSHCFNVGFRDTLTAILYFYECKALSEGCYSNFDVSIRVGVFGRIVQKVRKHSGQITLVTDRRIEEFLDVEDYFAPAFFCKFADFL